MPHVMLFVPCVTFFPFSTRMSMLPFSLSFCDEKSSDRSPLAAHLLFTILYNTNNGNSRNDGKVYMALRHLFHYYSSAFAKSEAKCFSSNITFCLLYYTLLFPNIYCNQLGHNISHRHAYTICSHSLRCKHVKCLLQLKRTSIPVFLCKQRFASSYHAQRMAKETFFLRRNTFERYFINGGWNRQRGQKLTCYIVRAIHWTGRNTQHERAIVPTCIPNAREGCGLADCNCGLRASYTFGKINRNELVDTLSW